MVFILLLRPLIVEILSLLIVGLRGEWWSLGIWRLSFEILVNFLGIFILLLSKAKSYFNLDSLPFKGLPT